MFNYLGDVSSGPVLISELIVTNLTVNSPLVHFGRQPVRTANLLSLKATSSPTVQRSPAGGGPTSSAARSVRRRPPQ